MKKLIFAAITLLGFSAASIAQTTPANTQKNKEATTQTQKKMAKDEKTKAMHAKSAAHHAVAKTSAVAPAKKEAMPVKEHKEKPKHS